MDNTSDFVRLFLRATDKLPYPYQVVLAETPVSDCVISVSTGCGKTAAVILWWLYQSECAPAETPLRLVYCLPTRALVAQTAREARNWVSHLSLSEDVPIYVLEGGEIEEEWELSPEKRAVIIGTQDLLLSRALNRGYAMNPARWPISFGLLNNDCAWVMDETQLMSSGLFTTAQLQALRQSLGTYGRTVSIWMSATMEAAKIETVDFKQAAAGLPRITLQEEDRKCPELDKRLTAPKRLLPAPESCRLPEGLAEFVAEKHGPGTQTLVVVNRVERAKEVFRALRKKLPGEAGPELLLAHSHFRPHERALIDERLRTFPGGAGRIIVATQVVEAGVDISSALLVTDLAPWASMVQRFGRCNRGGEYEDASVYWVDRPLLSKQEKLRAGELDEKERIAVALPYASSATLAAKEVLAGLRSAAAPDLPVGPELPWEGHVLRRRDLLDLFDTSRDLSGFDMDVSRFVRDADDHDVFVAWRPGNSTAELQHSELCAVPIGSLKDFLKKRKVKALAWDVLEREWSPVREAELRPGLRVILNVLDGGYSPEYGWSPLSTNPVEPVPIGAKAEPDSMSADGNTFGVARTIEDHTDDVVTMTRTILAALAGVNLGGAAEDLLCAATYHDLGKAHPVFQATLNADGSEGKPLAKAPPPFRRHARPFFRHELASALAMLQMGLSDLAAYLAAAHHGKVRLTIRSLPGEVKPAETDRLFARGIFHGEELPAVDFKGVSTLRLALDLEPMMLGSNADRRPSWAERMLGVRDNLGPFRIAYLEALLRAADRRASAKGGMV